MAPSRALRILIVALGIGTVLGVQVGAWLGNTNVYTTLFLVGIALCYCAYHFKAQRVVLAAIAVMLVGGMSGMVVGAKKAIMQSLDGQSMKTIARVSSFPRDNGTTFAYTLDTEHAPMRLTSPMYLERGSVVRLECKLKVTGSRYACSGGSVTVIATPSRLLGALNRIRTSWYQKTLDLLPIENAALLAGMVYGGDDALGKVTRDHFRAAGLSHLVAVSGANLAVVTVLIYGLLTATLFRRKQAAVITIALLALTVLFVGGEASVLRAATMGAVMLIAKYLGRPQSGINALALTAALMLFHNPWLHADLGFLLSVSATAGLMLLSRPLEQLLVCIPEFGDIRQAVTTALAAHIATVPVIALTVGTVSIISPIANVFAAPFVASIFLLGLVWFIILPITPLTNLLTPILNLLLGGLRFVAALFASVPGSNLTSPIAIMLGTAAALIALAILLRNALLSGQHSGT